MNKVTALSMIVVISAPLLLISCEEENQTTSFFGDVVDAHLQVGIPDVPMEINGYRRKFCVIGDDCDERVSVDDFYTDEFGSFDVTIDRHPDVDYYEVYPDYLEIAASGGSATCAVFGVTELTGLERNEVHLEMDCHE